MALTKGLRAAAAFGVIVVVALGTSAIAASGSATQARSLQVAVVASVYDGDTLSLRDGRRVRLLQIDTPELGSESATPGRRGVLWSVSRRPGAGSCSSRIPPWTASTVTAGSSGTSSGTA